MNVYEVEMPTERKGYRFLCHLRATDEADALARATQRFEVVPLGVVFRRPCTEAETAEQVEKDGAV